MFRRVMTQTVIALSLAMASTVCLAASADEFKSALAKAEAAQQQAGALKNQWTTTAQELKAAQDAAAKGDFDQAVKHAKLAEGLANASIAQAKEQAIAWTQAIIR